MMVCGCATFVVVALKAGFSVMRRLKSRKMNKIYARNKLEIEEAKAEYDRSQDPFMQLGLAEVKEMCLDA